MNYPTYVTIAKLLNIKHNNTLTPSKTLTVVNQTEVVPILHYVTILLKTSIEDNSRQFTIPQKGSALVYIDDILLSSNSKDHMFHLIEQLHLISTKHNLKLAPEKSFSMLLGHEIGYNTIKPIHSKIVAIHKILLPTGRVVLMSFIRALNFYTKFIEKLHVNLKPFYDPLYENTPWKWTDEHETLFHKLKKSLTAETELTIPNTKPNTIIFHCS